MKFIMFRPNKLNFMILMLMIELSLMVTDYSWAGQQWYFSWSCPKCYKIGARTGGTEGPYATEWACKSDEMKMRSTGGVSVTRSCYTVGTPSAPSSVRPDKKNQDYQFEVAPGEVERYPWEKKNDTTKNTSSDVPQFKTGLSEKKTTSCKDNSSGQLQLLLCQ